jgi:branched-chain amino acid transport system substrate-binding protein
MRSKARFVACGFPAPALACGVLLLAAACRPPAEEGPEEIRIGVIGPFSGSLEARIGDYVEEGARLAAEQAEARGGIVVNGRRAPIKLLFEDSRDRPEVALEAARKLVDRDGVAALIGPCLSRSALSVAGFAEQKRIPMVSPTSTHPQLTVGKPYVFRVTIVDDLQARALARYAREDLEVATAAVLYDVASVYNRNVADLFREAFTAGGGEIVAFEAYTTGEKDFRRPLLRIREAAPEVLLLPNYVDEVPLQAMQAREAGIGSVLLGTDSWDAEDYPRRPVFEGAIFTDDWLPGVTDEVSAEETAFLETYTEAYGRRPTNLAALAFDATGLVLAAIASRGSLDGETIRRGIAEIEAYRGVTGTLSFHGGGDPAKDIGIFAIRGGGIDFVKRMRP